MRIILRQNFIYAYFQKNNFLKKIGLNNVFSRKNFLA